VEIVLRPSSLSPWLMASPCSSMPGRCTESAEDCSTPRKHTLHQLYLSIIRPRTALTLPSVTLGLCITGNVPWVRGLLFLPAQVLAGIVAAALVECMTPGSVSSTRTTLAPGMSVAQGVFFEMFLTAQFVFTILMLAAEKSRDTFMAPIGIGLSLFVAELAGTLTALSQTVKGEI